MSKDPSKHVNLNTIILTAFFGVLAFYGERLQTGQDKILIAVTQYGVRLDQHDKDIAGVQADVKERPTRAEVMQRIEAARLQSDLGRTFDKGAQGLVEKK
jgi:hypothetical protein